MSPPGTVDGQTWECQYFYLHDEPLSTVSLRCLGHADYLHRLLDYLLSRLLVYNQLIQTLIASIGGWFDSFWNIPYLWTSVTGRILWKEVH